MTVDALTDDATVPALIDRIVADAPRSVAVRAAGRHPHLRRALDSCRVPGPPIRQLGVKPGDLVGLCLNRSVSLVVAALAIFKADGVYVAIDSKYPDERIRWMLDDSAAVAVLSDVSTADGWRLRRRRPHRRARRRRGCPTSTTTPRARARDAGIGTRTRRPRLCRVHLGIDRTAEGRLVEHAGLANLDRLAPQRLCA